MSKVKIYGSIEKVDEQDDGTLKVSGIASSESVDSQGEIVTASAMKAAIPDYMKFGAVREMHQPLAAGTALKCSVDDAGVTHLEAHIVDPIAVKKVLTGVYKGFSIGGKVKGRDDVNKNTITALRLTEISLVDVPANPDAVLALSKLDDEKVESLNDFVEKWAGEEIGDVMCATSCLMDCFYLLQKEKSEAEPSPEQVVALTAVVDNLKSFIASEIKEDNSEKVAKKGARFSKSTKATLSELHKAVNGAKEHLEKLGYEAEEEGEEEGEGKEPKKDDEEEKGKSDEINDLRKANEDTVAKLNSLTEELTKVNAENTELKAQVEDLKSKPAPTKGAVTAVAKGADTSSKADDPKIEPIRKGDGTVDEVATLIKSVHFGAPVSASR